MKILTCPVSILLSMVALLISPGTQAVELHSQSTTPTLTQEQKIAGLATLNQLTTQTGQSPRNVQAKFKYANQLAYLGRDTEAIKAFQALTQRYPELPEPYNNLAVLHAKYGRYDEARATLEAALRANPSYVPTYRNLGAIYLQLAALSYQHALKRNAQDKFSAQRQQQIQAILTPALNVPAPAPQKN